VPPRRPAYHSRLRSNRNPCIDPRRTRGGQVGAGQVGRSAAISLARMRNRKTPTFVLVRLAATIAILKDTVLVYFNIGFSYPESAFRS